MRDLRFAAAAATLLLAPLAHAEDNDGTPEQVVITGTRVENRSALESAVPVDVVSSENVGVTEVTQALSTTLPSYNFPRPGVLNLRLHEDRDGGEAAVTYGDPRELTSPS
jgi:hypothetical protein